MQYNRVQLESVDNGFIVTTTKATLIFVDLDAALAACKVELMSKTVNTPKNLALTEEILSQLATETNVPS